MDLRGHRPCMGLGSLCVVVHFRVSPPRGQAPAARVRLAGVVQSVLAQLTFGLNPTTNLHPGYPGCPLPNHCYENLTMERDPGTL